MPLDYFHNTWIMSIDQEDPITVGGAIDILNYLRKDRQQEVVLQLHKRTAHNVTLLNECRSLSDPFERPCPSTVVKMDLIAMKVLHNLNQFHLELEIKFYFLRSMTLCSQSTTMWWIQLFQ